MILSDQALGALMMALQKSLLEQSDIVPVLKDFQFSLDEKEELVCINPPSFKLNQEPEIEEDIDIVTADGSD